MPRPSHMELNDYFYLKIFLTKLCPNSFYYERYYYELLFIINSNKLVSGEKKMVFRFWLSSIYTLLSYSWLQWFLKIMLHTLHWWSFIHNFLWISCLAAELCFGRHFAVTCVYSWEENLSELIQGSHSFIVLSYWQECSIKGFLSIALCSCFSENTLF